MQLLQSLIWLLAGIGIFIVGMNFMSEALEKSAGEGMKRLLGRISNNRFSGVGIGAYYFSDNDLNSIQFLVLQNIPLHGHVDFIPGLLSLTYVRNTGAAFSSFEGQQWLFALIFAVFTVAIVYEYVKKSMPFTTLERWLIAAIYAGGLGNMIDRVRLGYVVDMIETTFMEFPVFNVADIFITCGCILMMVHLIFFNKEFWKEEKK